MVKNNSNQKGKIHVNRGTLISNETNPFQCHWFILLVDLAPYDTQKRIRNILYNRVSF